MKINRFVAVGAGLLLLQVILVASVRYSRSSLTLLKDEPWKVAGNPHGKVYLVEFSDFVCPHCYDLQPVLKRLITEFPQLYVIFKHYPVMGDRSEIGAEAAECAGDQGKFWEYSDLLYENRGKWYSQVDKDPHRNIGPPLLQLAEEAGLETETFKNCLKSRAKTSVVRGNAEEGKQWLVEGTPTVLLNGRKIMRKKDYDALRHEIEMALAKSQ